METVTIDLIVQLPSGAWGAVLVEQGPWAESEVETNLRRLQARLYNCVDAAIDGTLAERYPESSGKALLVRLNAYDTPECDVSQFFERFSTTVLKLPDYAAALKSSKYVSKITFELNLRHV